MWSLAEIYALIFWGGGGGGGFGPLFKKVGQSNTGWITILPDKYIYIFTCIYVYIYIIHLYTCIYIYIGMHI